MNKNVYNLYNVYDNIDVGEQKSPDPGVTAIYTRTRLCKIEE